ncbi:GNAT family N-acetyltransferase [Sulfobacillus harzensis]|uniref:GNAT family N-acetyltransferase n=1 Tax=Sulfobacillus harzensis TaxID=2729629 RepID=A0A7Y0L6P2_9FIRM|nr:GNAT family N-acetyltransferase [Sulfobacillus harzensis]NMP24314.1 GNAT family N-acetyltransferase [Sulfobacillus harzensis]
MATIRDLSEADILLYRDLQQDLDQETPFMLFEPGEAPADAAFWEARLKPFLTEPRHHFWVAEDQGQLVGFLRLVGNRPRRLQHTALVVMGIRQSYWGQGLGTRLMETAIDWAKEQGLSRLELTVVADNWRALALYLKMGFQVEGFRRRSLRMADGTYREEYSMAKLLGKGVSS